MEETPKRNQKKKREEVRVIHNVRPDGSDELSLLGLKRSEHHDIRYQIFIGFELLLAGRTDVFAVSAPELTPHLKALLEYAAKHVNASRVEAERKTALERQQALTFKLGRYAAGFATFLTRALLQSIAVRRTEMPISHFQNGRFNRSEGFSIEAVLSHDEGSFRLTPHAADPALFKRDPSHKGNVFYYKRPADGQFPAPDSLRFLAALALARGFQQNCYAAKSLDAVLATVLTNYVLPEPKPRRRRRRSEEEEEDEEEEPPRKKARVDTPEDEKGAKELIILDDDS
jgi:hypothetical protein